MNKTHDFKVGQRVQSAPWTDRFMRGARWGDVVAVTKLNVVVKFDKLAKPVMCGPIHIRDEFGF